MAYREENKGSYESERGSGTLKRTAVQDARDRMHQRSKTAWNDEATIGLGIGLGKGKRAVEDARESFVQRSKNAWRKDDDVEKDEYVDLADMSAHASVLTSKVGEHHTPLAQQAHSSTMQAVAHGSASAHSWAARDHQRCAEDLNVSNNEEHSQARGAHLAVAAKHEEIAGKLERANKGFYSAAASRAPR